MPKLSDNIRGNGGVKAVTGNRKEPLWKGPEKEGITFSLLSRFLCCRERFRLLVCEGLKPTDSFNHRLEYGNMWHICEEAFAGGEALQVGGNDSWQYALQQYAMTLCKRYPTQQEEVDKWYNVCKVQFPIYVDYWSKHPDVTNRTPLLQEQTFSIPYTLPSGRKVLLRGKWDSVDLVESNGVKGIWLQENKTKGDINKQQIKRQLTFDLQTMMYLIALDKYFHKNGNPVIGGKIRVKDENHDCECSPINGVRYNVIRRPLSGGRGTIRQHQPTKSNPQGESKEVFYKRLADEYIKAEPETYFMRWKCEVTAKDIEVFKVRCFNPILEQLCDWYEWITTEGDNFLSKSMHILGVKNKVKTLNATHWQHPYGVYNPLNEGGSSELDEYMTTGSTVGLQRTENLFPELT